MTPTKDAILSLLGGEAARPMTLADLLAALRAGAQARGTVRRLLQELQREGLVVKTRSGAFGLTSKMDLVVGRVSCHRDGFGFVVPDAGGEDLYVSPRDLRGVMHRDRVIARREARSPFPVRGGPQRASGKILRVIERGQTRIVGRYNARARGGGFVAPDDERIGQEIAVAPGKEGGARRGETVVVRITHYPVGDFPAQGEVERVLGEPGALETETLAVLYKHHVRIAFPPEALAQADALPGKIGPLDGRLDLRDKPFCTVDGETARDFDDAICLEGESGGRRRLWVAIADVAHFVPEGSPIDREAAERGTSVYFPDRAIPMLPERLTADLCSLRPDEDRLALAAELLFGPAGELEDSRVHACVIRSKRRFTYTEVQALLDGEDAALRARESAWVRPVHEMAALAMDLRRLRAARGSIDFDLPEPRIVLDLTGAPEAIVRSPRTLAHQIVEEFMIRANEAVATRLFWRKAPSLYRVHEAPAADSLEALRDYLAAFGRTLGGGEGGPRPADFQALLESVKGRPEERSVNAVVLRSLKQARYAAAPHEHFGLASELYTHFTSPIRRYPDLVVHRLARRRLLGEKDFPAPAEERLAEIAERCSRLERAAMAAEREIVDYHKTRFMRDKIGEVFRGRVASVTPFGFFVELEEYYVEGLVHLSALRDDYYHFHERRLMLQGERGRRTFSIGDPATVRLVAANLAQRRLDFELAEEAPAPSHAAKRRSTPTSPRRV